MGLLQKLFGAGARSKPLVLHVDDDQFINTTVEQMLRQLGCDSIAATNGADAVELAKKKKPDAILLDAMMPGASGYDTAEALRQFAQTKDIPIIMLTGVDTVKDVDKAHQWVSGYIVKPVILERLRAKLSAVIKLPT